MGVLSWIEDLVDDLLDAGPLGVMTLATGPFLIIGALLYGAFRLFENPVVDQTPLAEAVTVEVTRSCSTAWGPCTSCSPGADGKIDCASITTGRCPGERLMREVRQEMTVTRKRGEPRAETVVLESEAMEACH